MVPKPLKKTSHVMMIDAGSGGSRLHVYEFDKREFNVIPAPISHVSTDASWTSRLKPGLSSFAATPDDQLHVAVAEYLYPLIDFATMVLKEKKDEFGTFHLYLKATGGMRTLSHRDRMRIINVVRDLFRNDITPRLFTNTSLPVTW
jgi:Golgi nucleoside diphosphatase